MPLWQRCMRGGRCQCLLEEEEEEVEEGGPVQLQLPPPGLQSALWSLEASPLLPWPAPLETSAAPAQQLWLPAGGPALLQRQRLAALAALGCWQLLRQAVEAGCQCSSQGALQQAALLCCWTLGCPLSGPLLATLTLALCQGLLWLLSVPLRCPVPPALPWLQSCWGACCRTSAVSCSWAGVCQVGRRRTWRAGPLLRRALLAPGLRLQASPLPAAPSLCPEACQLPWAAGPGSPVAAAGPTPPSCTTSSQRTCCWTWRRRRLSREASAGLRLSTRQLMSWRRTEEAALSHTHTHTLATKL
jgi:hypothetical protein